VSYEDGRTDDAHTATAWMRSRWPGARIVVTGVCTGAFYGVHAVAAGVDADALVAVNPQLYWREGMKTDLGPAMEAILARRSAAAARDVGKWMRLLRGGYGWADIQLALRGYLRGAFAGLLPAAQGDTLGGGMPRLDLDALFPAHIPTHLVFCQDDEGLGHLKAHGSRPFKRLMAKREMHLHIVEAADHTISRESMRPRFDALLLDLVQR
jgi:hypothetical protein